MQEHETLALEAATISRLQAEGDEGDERAQREADERPADLNQSVGSTRSMPFWTARSGVPTPRGDCVDPGAIGLPIHDVDELEAVTKH